MSTTWRKWHGSWLVIRNKTRNEKILGDAKEKCERLGSDIFISYVGADGIHYAEGKQSPAVLPLKHYHD